jgi:hypothetical protein
MSSVRNAEMKATMRRLPKDGIVLHGLGSSFSRDRMDAAVRAVSSEIDTPVLDVVTARYPEWRIGHPDVPVSISANPAAPWSEFCVSILDSHLERYGTDWIVELFKGLSIACNVGLSRTTAWGGVGFVREQELAGQLEFVDWFQYWAKPIVDRWGMAFLTAGPFHRVEAHSDGCTLLLTAEPDDEGMSRKSAAEYLGVQLRPVFGRLETGEPFQIPWR